MGVVEYTAAGSFVHAPAFHSHYAVFNYVYNADAVCASDFVKLVYKRNAFHFLSVKRDGNPFFKFNFNIFRLVRRFFWNDSH